MNTHKNISDYYNRIYAENNNVFGVQPLPLVKKILEYTSSGTVIDLGAGEGRNSLFLASKGFQVLAVDISPVAIQKINELAALEKIKVETRVEDITKFNFSGSYDLTMCTFTLHHLLAEQAITFIHNMKQHTKIGGLNIVTSFTNDGDFYRNNTRSAHFYLQKNQLKDFYKEWEILNYFEKEGGAFAKHPDGAPMTNVFAGILARKT